MTKGRKASGARELHKVPPLSFIKPVISIWDGLRRTLIQGPKQTAWEREAALGQLPHCRKLSLELGVAIETAEPAYVQGSER